MGSEVAMNTIVEDATLDGFVIDDEEETGDAAPKSPSNSSSILAGEKNPRTFDVFFDDAYSTSTIRGRIKYCFIFITLGFGNMGDSTELVSVGYLMVNKDFQDVILHDDFSTDGSIVASVALAGMIFGGLVAGSFEDTFGRKRSLLGGLVLNGIACVLTAFASNVTILSAFRFFVGFGIGAVLSSLFALSAELSPPSQRGLFVTLVSGFWSFGMLYTSAVANSIMGIMGLSWRVFIIMTAIPNLLSVLMVWMFVPDSPRFLALHGKFEEAVWCANKVANLLEYKGPNLSVEEVKYYFHCERRVRSNGSDAVKNVDDAHDNDVLFVVGESGISSTREALDNILALYCKYLRNRTISLQLLWIFLEMGTGLASFLNVIFEEAGKGAYVGLTLLGIGALVGCVLGAICLDKLGRKSSISLCMAVSSVAMLGAAWVVSGDTHPTLPLFLSILIFSVMSSLAWNANMILSAEMFPTKVRSTGLGYVAATGRIACIVQQFINGALVGQPVVLLLVASALLLVGASTMLILRTHDMARRPLTDAVMTRGTKGGGGRGDFMMVPIGKEVGVSRKGEPRSVDYPDELPRII